ncbi:hypothetical protein MKK55_18700 [Methylobacterium sp. J-059]|uniref:hypothetical protein n=1 Tax=Methylobacterium sp. J-059 TaxID=2836643 RepID=UPI001FBB49E7|nr:hypothetical protein [Methylobacterium sp. J-059]MCJ2040961.1 hypothetical protein [Methylobacterium sp. J-059]
MPASEADRERFRAIVAKRRDEPPPPGFLDEAGHDRVAREAVAANPELAKRARRLGDYLPLIRAAERAAGRGNVSTFLLASLIGKMVRGEA